MAALMLAAGGVSWAAGLIGTGQLRNGAVTSAKLRNRAVSSRKIAFGAVGAQQINPAQVQARIRGGCKVGEAVTAVARDGRATCTLNAPYEWSATSASPVSIGTTDTSVASMFIPPAGEASPRPVLVPWYLMLANPLASVSDIPEGELIDVTCAIGLGASGPDARTVTFAAQSGRLSGAVQHAAIPLQLETHVTANPNVRVTCKQSPYGGSAPAHVTVTTALDAITNTPAP